PPKDLPPADWPPGLPLLPDGRPSPVGRGPRGLLGLSDFLLSSSMWLLPGLADRDEAAPYQARPLLARILSACEDIMEHVGLPLRVWMKRPDFMGLAMAEAEAAAERGEVPVGAALILGGEAIATAGNRTRELNDPTAHAEMLVIRAATAELSAERLTDADLYVTLEPCTMCAAAISFARIRRLYFGALDEKGGAVVNGVRFFAAPTCHHQPEI